MNLTADTKLYEQISHTTDSAPYSIHFTEVSIGADPALYLHWHKEMEFLLLTSGALLFQMEDTPFTLQAGDAVFIPSGILHSAKSHSDQPISFYALVFSPEFLISSFDTTAYNTYVLPVMHNNLKFATSLQTNHSSWQQNILSNLNNIFFSNIKEELFIRSQLLLLWNTFYQNHIAKTKGTDTNHLTLNRTLSGQLQPVINYMQENYQQALTLNELSSIAHLSEGQFCRSFKHFTGMTPFAYLVRYRILQSCHDLSSTNKKITDIATTHGFNNISYYNRAFLKVMNLTPTEYRKQFLKP
ncbi:MAG: AraC family transcriptional regulator [Lachnospiraceae bacterium]|nr:AraC family transcriptional regulator [Lachnospiraceae bacterium]MBP3578199.1 AraC family transcriptional regulator [Lachnospiraceae bacterium]